MKTDKKIIKYKDLAKLRAKASKEGKTIVFTSGCYDILHLGHVIHFNFCKQQADILVVTVGNYKTIRDLKGPTRPINDENFRSRLLAALELVDYVVISEEFGKMDHVKSTELLRPDKYVLNATDSAIAEKRVICEKNGVELVLCKRLPPGHKKGGISSSGIEKQLKS
ncbi:MAG: adenylyltransferase/cytidyltransferase family protein [Candidatus Berkelbacteria bacterium]